MRLGFGVRGSEFRVLMFGFVLLVGLLLASTIPLLAQSEVSPTEAMARANQHYEAGEFAEAISIYNAIIEAGVDNSDLYYNLANAYFKQGELGHAIVNYRRAQLLSPRDSDITTNLATARSQTVDKLEDETGINNLVKVAEEWLTLNEAAVLALILWVLICYFAVLAILLPRQRRVFSWVIVVLGVFLVIGVFSIANRLYTAWQYPPAVVVAQTVEVTSGPGDVSQYLVEFNLHSGAEVHILESRPAWRRIMLPGNLQGWAPAEAVETVER